MISFEHTEVQSFDAADWQRIPRDIYSAFLNYPARGFRKTTCGKYETFVSDKGKSISLGTYSTESEAAQAIAVFRARRFLKLLSRYGLDVAEGKLAHKNYVAFSNGEIVSLLGNRLYGHTDHSGYNEVIINGRQRLRHRIIAEAFVQNPENKAFVNHKNGKKLDNRAENLEWVTRSENTVHAFKTGLQTHIRKNGVLYSIITPEEDKQIKDLHLVGYTDKQIAEQLNRSREAISKRIRRMGLR